MSYSKDSRYLIWILAIILIFSQFSCATYRGNEPLDYSFVEYCNEELSGSELSTSRLIILPVENSYSAHGKYNKTIDNCLLKAINKEFPQAKIISQDTVKSIIKSKGAESKYQRFVQRLLEFDEADMSALNSIFGADARTFIVFTATGNEAHYIDARIFYPKLGVQIWKGAGYSSNIDIYDQNTLIYISCNGLARRLGLGISDDTMPMNSKQHYSFHDTLVYGFIADVVILILSISYIMSR